MSPTLRKAYKRFQDCYSFKGEDFCCCPDKRYVKRFTRRALRRLNKALAREGG